MQTLDQFLSAYDPAKYDRPSVTVDVALFCPVDGAPHALLIRRGRHPNLGKFALPGGFIDMGETLYQAAARELHEETHIHGVPLEPLGFFGEPTRDPRTRIITAGFAALVGECITPRAGDDAADAALFAIRAELGAPVAIPPRRRASAPNLIELPCSADGRLGTQGRALTIALSNGATALNSRLALVESPFAPYAVLLESDLAGDHALILAHALLHLSQHKQKAPQWAHSLILDV